MAEAVEAPGGYQAVQLLVAEQYVDEPGLLATQTNTMLVPANVGVVSSPPIIATAMGVIMQTGGSQDAQVRQPRAGCRRTGFAGRSGSLRGFGSAYFTPSSCARAPRRTLVIA